MIMFAEVRKNGQWHSVGKEFVSTYKELDGQLTNRVFDGKNMYLAELLREYSVYKAFTNDVSEKIRNSDLFKDGAGYFCTLRDIFYNINWDKEVYETGYISEWQYKRLKNGIEPANVLIFAGKRKVVSPFLMDTIINNPSLREEGVKYYVEYLYNKSTVKERCDFFFNVSIPELVKLVPENGTIDDVRIVFII